MLELQQGERLPVPNDLPLRCILTLSCDRVPALGHKASVHIPSSHDGFEPRLTRVQSNHKLFGVRKAYFYWTIRDQHFPTAFQKTLEASALGSLFWKHAGGAVVHVCGLPILLRAAQL